MTDTEILDALSDLLTAHEGAPLLVSVKDTGGLGLIGTLEISDDKKTTSEQPTLRDFLAELLE